MFDVDLQPHLHKANKSRQIHLFAKLTVATKRYKVFKWLQSPATLRSY